MQYQLVLSLLLVSLLTSFTALHAQSKKNYQSLPLGHGYEFVGNGKSPTAPTLSKVYTKIPIADNTCSDLAIMQWSSLPDLTQAIEVIQKYLQKKNPAHSRQVGNLKVTNQQLVNVAKKLTDWKNGGNALSFCELFDTYQLKGEDDKGHVHFTSYYTPLLQASRKKDAYYKYPIYRKPASWGGKRPTRKAIDQYGALAGKGLELAWTSSLLDNYFINVQGSGYVEFQDGQRKLLIFKGQNGYGYTSIGKYLVAQGHVAPDKISLQAIRDWFAIYPDSLHTILNKNRSYAFFEFSNKQPTGATATPLVQDHSIAVDPRYIPYGAVLLARVPILDATGQFTHHEWRLLFAQDKGGAIKGTGHIDLYAGAGLPAERKAGALHHYGNLFILLPKK